MAIDQPLIFPLRDHPEWRCDPRAITFLKTLSRRKVAAKTWFGNEPEAIDYDQAKYWLPFVALANNLEELSAVMTRAEGCPRLMAVRGAVRLSSVLKPEITRISRTDRDEPPDLEDVPRYWLMIDLDSKPEPKDFDWLSDPRRAAIWAAETYLPKSLQGVDFHYQYSSGAGIKPGLRLHFWFWLDKPKTSAELKRHFKRHLKQFDPALYNPSQPHYTAAPIFIRRPDPLVGRRSGSVLYE